MVMLGGIITNVSRCRCAAEIVAIGGNAGGWPHPSFIIPPSGFIIGTVLMIALSPGFMSVNTTSAIRHDAWCKIVGAAVNKFGW